jgi:hypothetical protein
MYVSAVNLQERRRGGGQERIMFIFMAVDDRDETRRLRLLTEGTNGYLAWLVCRALPPGNQGCDTTNQSIKPLTGQAQGLPRLKMAAENTLSRLPRIASSVLHPPPPQFFIDSLNTNPLEP